MSLRRDEGCIYLCFLLRPVGFCFSKILHLCHLGVTKSACPTAAEKCLSTAICPYSRWRSQPLSCVSRKQRYNTLDFPTENRVPRGTPSPLDTPAKGNAVSLWIPYANRDALAPAWKPELRGVSPSDTSEPKVDTDILLKYLCRKLVYYLKIRKTRCHLSQIIFSQIFV